MPFVQRVVQPVNLAQVPVRGSGYTVTATTTTTNTNTTYATATTNALPAKLPCIPDKCKNNNCINKHLQQQKRVQLKQLNVKDALASPTNTTSTTTTFVTTSVVVHAPHLNGVRGAAHDDDNDDDDAANASATLNGYGHGGHQHYGSDEEALTPVRTSGGGLSPSSPTPSPTQPPPISMKKLKHHVEFLSVSPTRNHVTTSGAGVAASATSTQQRRSNALGIGASTPSPTHQRIVPGYEFESISNITLSNALRQLASLVLLASNIFDDLQCELVAINDRAGRVQRKIVTVERRVCAYDPKLVTVPESDLLTFAQRKCHYANDKAMRNELFTTTSRPHSVRVLYEAAGRVTPPPQPQPSSMAGVAGPAAAIHSASTTRASSPYALNGAGELIAMDDGAGGAGAGAHYDGGCGSDELVYSSIFGKANRKMRTRIDAEIEIRLPAAIEDLRKWTSSEALGDVTVTPDCIHHVETSISTSMLIGDSGTLTPALSPSVLSADAVDALYATNASSSMMMYDATQQQQMLLPNDVNKDVPLNHRLPSPEEQCKIIALRYPAELISVDTSGKRFERMCAARKSTAGCYISSTNTNAGGSSGCGSGSRDGTEATNTNGTDDTQTVSRRSRSRKVRSKRRNTIAGIDQKEIQDAANGDSTATSGDIKNTLNATSSGGGHRTSSAVATTTTTAAADGEVRKSKRFGRSKSSDILKKDAVALPYDKGKASTTGTGTLTRLNSLKLWGRNRFKFMQCNKEVTTPTGSNSSDATALDNGNAAAATDNSHSHTTTIITAAGVTGVGGGVIGNDATSIHAMAVASATVHVGGAKATAVQSSSSSAKEAAAAGSRSAVSIGAAKTMIDGGADNEREMLAAAAVVAVDIGGCHGARSEGRFSHERKPSYSSSERSTNASSSGGGGGGESGQLRGKLQLAAGQSASSASGAGTGIVAGGGGGGSVRLRDTSSLNRQRRNGITTTGHGGHNSGSAGSAGSKDDQPHSSSGNWSASSESGRASIGSEITIQPKSSASNTSLNMSSFHAGSGPPSSMLSRRRFLNTSASSSVTSEGTATPELQATGNGDGTYPNHLDDETSSAYSCDTEGYYTSFHMDSGLRTLKEEEAPSFAHHLQQLHHQQLQLQQHQQLQQQQQAAVLNAMQMAVGNNSFCSGGGGGGGNTSGGSQQTTLTAENEYELFGRGSTSTTTSSAGTVCTTLMLLNEQASLNSLALAPDVPERISSLSGGGKTTTTHNSSGHNNNKSPSTSTLERSYSSSTISSTLERTGTIKRKASNSFKLLAGTDELNIDDDDADDDDDIEYADADVDGDGVGGGDEHLHDSNRRRQRQQQQQQRGEKDASCTPESQEEEFNFELPATTTRRGSRPHGGQPLRDAVTTAALISANVELWECSESSDLEGVERIERIKQKTALNAKRIPSMCIITPTTSDDENLPNERDDDGDEDVDGDVGPENDGDFDPNRTLTNDDDDDNELDVKRQEHNDINIESSSKAAAVPTTATTASNSSSAAKDHNRNHVSPATKRNSKLFEKLKVVLPLNVRRSSPGKSSMGVVAPAPAPAAPSAVEDDALYDLAGEYVTIADISNNNRHNRLPAPLPSASGGGGSNGGSALGIYYSNDIIRCHQQQPSHSSGGTWSSQRRAETTAAAATSASASTSLQQETDYVSLNDLPSHLKCAAVSSVRRAGAAVGGDFCAESEHIGQQRADARARQEPPPRESIAQLLSTASGKAAAAVPMYAEISELREEKSLLQHSPNEAAATTQQLSRGGNGNRSATGGVRVRINAQGKIIYDSDSLKRRKGAHTTFAPGPHVKETESALDPTTTTTTLAVSESSFNATATTQQQSGAFNQNAYAHSSAGGIAKLLLLNGGIAATRKVANVRPIVAKSPLSQQERHPSIHSIANAATITTASNNHQNTITNNNNNMPTPAALAAATTTATPTYNQHQHQNHQQQQQQEHKNLLANDTNPFFQSIQSQSPAQSQPSPQPSPLAQQQQQQQPAHRFANAALVPPVMALMMPSPSAKSTSSTGSSNASATSSTNATHSTLSSNSNDSNNSTGGGGGGGSGGGHYSSLNAGQDEGYQRFYRAPELDHHENEYEELPAAAAEQAAPAATATATASAFQRNTPVYWTLQSKRKTQAPPPSICRDDLYATPIRRSERAAAAAAAARLNGNANYQTQHHLNSNPHNNNNNNNGISPIVPRRPNGFSTSTPTKADDGQRGGTNTPPPMHVARNTLHWDSNSPERFNTCSDRIGHTKTSLLDFKKLLLAKSAKTSPVQKKVSAVELLKKSTAAAAAASAAASAKHSGATSASIAVPGGAAAQGNALNSSMKLLDLSGSPKTFANRRMLRQGQFGSPSKSFAPKLKSSTPMGWRQNHDVMSTTIPEANSEEDHSNTSGGSSKASVDSGAKIAEIKANFFLQNEENNFMRGELRRTLPPTNANANSSAGAAANGSNKYASGAPMCASVAPMVVVAAHKPTTTQFDASGGQAATAAAAMPALETAL